VENLVTTRCKTSTFQVPEQFLTQTSPSFRNPNNVKHFQKITILITKSVFTLPASVTHNHSTPLSKARQ